jgi:hypothetical protein
MIDASALLWRLALRGVDVGNRFDTVAQNWRPNRCVRASYAFNDVHAMMCFVGAGRRNEQQALLEAQLTAMETDATTPSSHARSGRPPPSRFRLSAKARYAECVERLRPTPPHCASASAAAMRSATSSTRP